MGGGKILPCNCKHEAQDQMHGHGMRVHTRIRPAQTTPREWRCTVCLATKSEGGTLTQKKQGK